MSIKLPCGTSAPLLFCCFSSCVTDFDSASILSTRSSANEKVKTRANKNTLFCNLKKYLRSEVKLFKPVVKNCRSTNDRK